MSDQNANLPDPNAQPAATGTAVATVDPNALPVKSGEDFIGEFEVMNLDKLKGNSFLVSVSREDRNKGKFICTTVHGPYDFYEMLEEVGYMWTEHQHHPKVYILEKDRTKAARYLDENTVDYIEANYSNIIIEGLLEGVFDEGKQYTCQAGVVEDTEGALLPKETPLALPSGDEEEDE